MKTSTFIIPASRLEIVIFEKRDGDKLPFITFLYARQLLCSAIYGISGLNIRGMQALTHINRSPPCKPQKCFWELRVKRERTLR